MSLCIVDVVDTSRTITPVRLFLVYSRIELQLDIKVLIRSRDASAAEGG
jgi:hypothetical protein